MAISTARSPNPFCLEPIKSPAKFFGRRKETRRVLSFLHREQCVSIVGPARIGKTSFLSHVAHPHVRAEQGRTKEQVFVYLDCHSLVNLDQGQCYLYLQEEIIRQVKNLDKAVGVRLEKAVLEVGSEMAYFGLNTLFRTAQASGLKLIVTLDNFEIIAQKSHLEENFFSALRSLPTNYHMAYLVASQSPLDTLERARPEASPFFNIFQPITLRSFTPEESRELVVTLLKQACVEFPEFAIVHILELGHNEPYNLQRAGHIAFQIWQENGGDLQMEHCEEIRRRFEEMED